MAKGKDRYFPAIIHHLRRAHRYLMIGKVKGNQKECNVYDDYGNALVTIEEQDEITLVVRVQAANTLTSPTEILATLDLRDPKSLVELDKIIIDRMCRP